jgi:predicted double-glycine peptidase
VHSMKELRFRSTTHQQYDFSCGSAALATLLTYHYGYPVSETTAFQAMWEHGDQAKIRREGFSLLDMQRYLAEIGFKADGFTVPLQKLVDSKLPAIVLITREHFESIWPTRLLFVIHDAPTKPAFNTAMDWRAAPHAPLADSVNQSAIDTTFALPKFGPGDF